MIECMNAEQFVYFIELMGDIVNKINFTLYTIEATTQTTYWSQVNPDWWCMIKIEDI
jgi:hypothetical protein